MKVYLIAGKARSGKTECAKILKKLLEEQGEKTVITEYSKYIKLFAKDLLGWDGIEEPKPRDFLQEMGNFVREEYSDIYFTNRMKEDLKIYEHFVDNVIISDARMPKELTELENFSPIKIRVVNDLNEYDLTASQANHVTEHALDDYKEWDYEFTNLTKEEMKEELRKVIG